MIDKSPVSSGWENPSPEEIKQIIDSSRTIAVVGLSSKPDRASYGVARYLQAQGYEIIPVNPRETEILGQKSYPNLAAIGRPVDIVDVFRRSEDTPPIVKEAIECGARHIWLQEGIFSQESYDLARSAGIPIVMNLCLLKEHQRSRG
jgi:predicted CoA-binding protein